MWRPDRAIRSSGEAPKKVPSGTGREKIVQFGSWDRSRRNTEERGSGPSRWAVTVRDRTTFRNSAPGARMMSAARWTMAAWSAVGSGVSKALMCTSAS